MPKQCENCQGRGLVGQGDRPFDMQGHITTCPKCTGTGKVEEDGSAHLNEEAAAPVAVDNSVDGAEPAKKPSILERVLHLG